MNIGLLNDMVASSSKVGNLALEDDDVGAKFVSAPETNLVKRIAFGEVVTTNASHLQSRIWHSHVSITSSLLNMNSEVVTKCRSKLKSQTEVLVGLNTYPCIGKGEAKLADYS
jgi:hypothetical protein